MLNRNPSVKKEPNQNSSVKPKKEPNQIKRERPKSLAPSVGPQKVSRLPLAAALLLIAAALLDFMAYDGLSVRVRPGRLSARKRSPQ